MRSGSERVPWRAGIVALLLAPPALAQVPPTASFPPDPPAEPSTQPPAPAPTPAPVPNPPPAAPAPAAAGAATPTTTPPAPPTYPEAPPPAYAPRAVYEPPPPPPKPEESKLPGFSVRVDPFNLLLEGKLAFELEVEILKFLTAEVVPVFVVNDTPPTFGYVVGRDEELARESNGLGPLAGASIDVGLWPEGKALKGYVVRAILTNYSYRYEARTATGVVFDSVEHVDRHLLLYLGSHSRWGAFTIAGGFGLGAELNNERRCFRDDENGIAQPTTNCSRNERLIRLIPDPVPTAFLPVADLSGGLGGVQLLVRFSLGVAF